MEESMCRICRGGESQDSDSDECSQLRKKRGQKRIEPLISPCNCSCCEVCHSPYRLHWRTKPLSEWRSPSFAHEDCVRLRLSLISCLLTIADMFFCASSFSSRPSFFWQSRSLHAFMLITLSLSWAYCFGVNVIFWYQLFQRWRRQNLVLTL